MLTTASNRSEPGNLVFLGVSLVILVLGFQLAFYSIFSQFSLYDDEGFMLLPVQQFIDNPAAYDQISRLYGPLYYLHKYAIYQLLDTGVSHYTNRLTTITFWLMTAWAGAQFVFRMTGSVVLGVIALFQLIILLRQLVAEPGHPHELGLLILFTALLVSTFIATRRSRLLVISSLGACIGSLLLVKVNLGLFLAAAVALSLVYTLPASLPIVCLRRLASLLAVLLPAALMWRHLEQTHALNFLVLSTSTIAGCIIVLAARDLESPPEWMDVLAAMAAALFIMGVISLVLVGMGNTVGDIVRSVFIRSFTFASNAYVVFAPMSSLVFYTAPAVLATALSCRYLASRINRIERFAMAVAGFKVMFAAYALYMLNFEERAVFGNPLLMPLVWILLLYPGNTEILSFKKQFPRLLLCFLAAFLILQEYPVPGSHRIWGSLLLIPFVTICLSDALTVFLEKISGRLPVPGVTGFVKRNSLILSLAICGLVTAGYYQKINLTGLKTAYFSYSPLDLPGTGAMRLPRDFAKALHTTVEEVKRQCDGWLGFPEFHSLYLWTGISPPSEMTNASILELEDEIQYRVIRQMESYARPCIVYSKEILKVRARNTRLDETMPLVRYIRNEFVANREVGWVLLLTKSEPIPSN